MDSKYIAIDKAQTDELIDTLKFLQFQVLANLKNDKDGGLIAELNSIDKMIRNHSKVMTLINQNAYRTKNTIEENKDKVDENVQSLQKVAQSIENSLELFDNFEMNNSKKLENYLSNLNLKALVLSDDFSKELLKELSKVKSDIEKNIQERFLELNKSIDESTINNADVKKLVELNTSVSTGLKNLEAFNLEAKKLKGKNLFLNKVVSFLGGGILFSFLILLFS